MTHLCMLIYFIKAERAPKKSKRACQKYIYFYAVNISAYGFSEILKIYLFSQCHKIKVLFTICVEACKLKSYT